MRFFIPPKLVLLFSITITINHVFYSTVYSQDQTDNWTTYNHQRVNLRSGSSTTSGIISTLEQWSKLTVVQETQGWVQVSLESGQTGWVSSDFVIPEDRVKALIPESPVELQQPIDNTTPSDTGFTSRPEPNSVTQLDQSGNENSFFSIFQTFLLGISLIANVLLVLRARSKKEPAPILSDSQKLQQDYKLLQKVNHDLKEQISFADEKYAELQKTLEKTNNEFKSQKELAEQELTKQKNKYHILEDSHKNSSKQSKASEDQISKLKQENDTLLKEIESLNQKLGESNSVLQEKAISHTLAEQNHKEILLNKQNEINSIESSISDIKHRNQQLENELQANTTSWNEEKTKLDARIGELENKLQEKDMKFEEEIAKEKSNLKTVLQKELNEEFEKEKKNIKEMFEKERNELQSQNDHLENVVQELNEQIEKEKSAVKQDHDTSNNGSKSADTGDGDLSADEIEALKNANAELITKLQLSEKASQDSEKKWTNEKEELLETIKILENKSVPVPDTKTKETPKEITAKAPAESQFETQDTDSYGDYARHFFHQIKKL